MLGPSLRMRKKLEYPPWDITPLCSLLHKFLKDMYMCLQDELKLKVSQPAGQMQY